MVVQIKICLGNFNSPSVTERHIISWPMDKTKRLVWLQTTHPTSGGAVTAVINCCANCLETSRPQQMGARFWTSRPCGPAGWLALLLIKTGDVETNPGPTNTHQQVRICDICHKQIHGREQISIRCNRIEHWVHVRCAGIHLAQFTDTWTESFLLRGWWSIHFPYCYIMLYLKKEIVILLWKLIQIIVLAELSYFKFYIVSCSISLLLFYLIEYCVHGYILACLIYLYLFWLPKFHINR